METSTNLNDNFFKGLYKEVWRGLIPPGLTEAEVGFIQNIADLKSGDAILDVMCGYGRHSIALAQQGYHITSVDNEADYIDEIKSKAAAEGLNIVAKAQNIASASFDIAHQAAICMGNSFSFFDKERLIKVFTNISNALLPGSVFVINTWAIAEIAIRQFKDKTWQYVGDFIYLSDNEYLFSPTRIASEQMIIAPGGQTEKLSGIDYIYSIAEVEAILKQTGFILEKVYSTPKGRKFTLGDNQAYIVARKT